MRSGFIFCLLLVMSFAGVVVGEDSTSLDSIFVRLSDADYQVRESAQHQLESTGPEVLDEVLTRYRQLEDIEARWRVRAYLRSYFRKYVKAEEPQRQQPGFLGVALNQTVVEDQPAASVERVMSGTAAERMGLEVGDVIVAFQGRAVVGEQAAPELVREIQSTPPGTLIRLTVNRAGQPHDLQGTLDAKPAEMMSTEEQLQREAEEQARRDAATRAIYDQWWADHLDGQPDPARVADARPWEQPESQPLTQQATLPQHFQQ